MDSTMKTSIPKKCHKNHHFFFCVNNLIVYIEMEINFCPKKNVIRISKFFFLVNNLIVYMEMEINFCTSLILDFILFFGNILSIWLISILSIIILWERCPRTTAQPIT